LAKISGLVRAAIQLCQRNSHRLETSKSETIWFTLLDTVMVPQRRLTSQTSNKAPTFAKQIEDGFRGFIQTILESMMGYVALPTILNKILHDHSSGHFWEYKDIIFGILENYNYENTLLRTTNHILEKDLYTSTKELLQKKKKALVPSLGRCDMCSTTLTSGAGKTQGALVTFHCGHTYHATCMRGASCMICTSVDTREKGKKRVEKFKLEGDDTKEGEGGESDAQVEALSHLSEVLNPKSTKAILSAFYKSSAGDDDDEDDRRGGELDFSAYERLTSAKSVFKLRLAPPALQPAPESQIKRRRPGMLPMEADNRRVLDLY